MHTFRVSIKEIIQLYFFLVTTIFIFSFFPYFFRVIWSVILFIVTYRSDKNYFWLAFFFVILIQPFGLFDISAFNSSIGGPPVISFGSSFTFTFNHLFLIIFLIKAYLSKTTVNVFYRNSILYILYYFLFLILLSVVLWHTGFKSIINEIKTSVFWLLAFIYPKLIQKRENVYKFIYLILPVSLLVFIDAGYYVFSEGKYLLSMFNVPFNYNPDLYRYMIKGWLGFLLVFILSNILYYIDRRRKTLFLVISIASLIVEILSGTRSWFVIFVIIILVNYLEYRNLKTLFIYLIVFIIGFTFASRNDRFANAFDRTITVFEINQDGSNSNKAIDYKIEERLPVQIALIKTNPITGWGFTNFKKDVDVGVIGQIAEMGVIGLFLFIILWHRFYRETKNAMQKSNIKFKNVFKILRIGFLGLLISHFTTNQVFGINYYLPLLTAYFWLSDFFIKESRNEGYANI